MRWYCENCVKYVEATVMRKSVNGHHESELICAECQKATLISKTKTDARTTG